MFEHELNITPVKVDVQVTPEADPQSIFPGTGSAQRDDDEGDPYGGVVYKYDDSVVKVYVPNRRDGFSNGSAIYTGGNTWSGPSAIKENRAKVRVRVWSPLDFPCPDYVTSGSIQVHGGPGKRSFIELAHGLGTVPEYVTVQVVHGSSKWVSDGVGYVMTSSMTSMNTSWGGVLYAYNDSHIRIWLPSNDSVGSLYSTADGWGRGSNDKQNSGNLTVKMWKFFNGVDLFRNTKDIGSKATSIMKVMSFPSTFDIDNGLLSVMVKSTEGPNANFHFPATGSVQNTQPTGSYGGFVYAYSTSGMKLWQPPRSHGYLIYVNHLWGGGAFTQGTNSAQLVVQAWDAYTFCQTTVATSSTMASLTAHPTTQPAAQPAINMTAASGGQVPSSLIGHSNPPVEQTSKTNSTSNNMQSGSSVVNMSLMFDGKERDTSNNDTTVDQFKGLSLDLPWWAVGVAGGVTLLLLIGSISGLVQCIQRAMAKGKVEVKDRETRDRTKGKNKVEAQDGQSPVPTKGKIVKGDKIQAWNI